MQFLSFIFSQISFLDTGFLSAGNEIVPKRDKFATSYTRQHCIDNLSVLQFTHHFDLIPRYNKL